MDLFSLHRSLIDDYGEYTRSFIRIADDRIRDEVNREIDEGLLWPEPLLQLSPAYESGGTIANLVREGLLHRECERIFRLKMDETDLGHDLNLRQHQQQAIAIARKRQPYVITTGTGSGKSLCYIVPIVDHVLRRGSGRGIQAIVVYPMNALANSQKEELDKFLRRGFGNSRPPVTYARYTGQESSEERSAILENPPDILLTNFMMLELILTRTRDRQLVRHAQGLEFLVLDELHTYRGRQGADVAMLVRRCREACSSPDLICIGTSATMASDGDSAEQRAKVAEVASRMFGQPVAADHVIDESLELITGELDFDDPAVRASLMECVRASGETPRTHNELSRDPLASWIVQTLGVTREATTLRLRRQIPLPISGPGSAAARLAELCHISEPDAVAAISSRLSAGASQSARHPITGTPLFPFRLHQFFTRGDTVWATLEAESLRKITLRGQQFVPGDRSRLYFPLVFCRQCGHAYYRIDRSIHDPNAPMRPRVRFDRSLTEEWESGYLYLADARPWPSDRDAVIDRMPPELIQTQSNGSRAFRQGVTPPQLTRIAPDGTCSDRGTEFAFVPAPFRFCLACGTTYGARQRSDYQKLGTIGVDGRSTATTILGISALVNLRGQETLPPIARKLLTFTDNRQDASLQSGHFNDFVQIGLMRSALVRAVQRAGTQGVSHEDLAQLVEREMNLPADLYSNAPELRGAAALETRRVLRQVLAYFLYRDLKGGLRVTSPNLEGCGLLRFSYLGLDDAITAPEWSSTHPALADATPERRRAVIVTLLDHLRRSLAIKADSLDPEVQERMADASRQRLREPWVVSDPKELERSTVAWPRAVGQDDGIALTLHSAFGQFLRKPRTLGHGDEQLAAAAIDPVIRDLLRILTLYGLVEPIRTGENEADLAYQLPASAVIWVPGSGTPAIDPLRQSDPGLAGADANKYFVELYRRFADVGAGLEAREHTAQVDSEEREERERRFRTADLPYLVCSPTMELGVDIAQLNVVNMRNVPPTPANYAQRSGRAGRSGQPALVYTYCAGGSPHDQYYFNHPSDMVAGQVAPPRIDLTNCELLEAHVRAVWLSVAQLDLGSTLTDLLVVSEDDLTLPLKADVRGTLEAAGHRQQALVAARGILRELEPQLQKAIWHSDAWLEGVLQRLPQDFERACDRWRSLYRAAVQQRRVHNARIGDHTLSEADRGKSKQLRAHAESQIHLLTNARSAMEGDFYSYRYFASEGFLPGYNFPRLPLSAFIPARRGLRGKDEFLSRPRFLAIAEFGPRAVIYHEGARYRIHKVSLEVREDAQEVARTAMKICATCGYGHFVPQDPGPEVCESCGSPFAAADRLSDLIRLQNVSTKLAARITSDEEERQRVGYELRTTYRFADIDGVTQCQRAEVVDAGGATLMPLRYGDATTLWRINLGWAARRNPNERGFQLDTTTGYWATNREAEDSDPEDPLGNTVVRVVPFVEDRRNALVIDPPLSVGGSEPPSTEDRLRIMASLQSALRQSIQRVFQLESSELATESLPSVKDRRQLLLYESAEGGAGVLRQVVEDPTAFPRVIRKAIELCHFDPDTGADLGAQAGRGRGCEAACYDCLLDYGNQTDHRHIDRKLIHPILRALALGQVRKLEGALTREQHATGLRSRCDSDLERRLIDLLERRHLRLPSHAQRLLSTWGTQPDFVYEQERVVVYVDGPHHDTPEQQVEDRQITKRLEGAGFLVLRFHHAADWNAVLDQHRDVFARA